MTLNLHGYHPTGEATRWVEFRTGKKQRADSDLFFFTEEEIRRGHARRLDRLAMDLRSLQPDVVLLQEVAASLPVLPKSCERFLAREPGDGPGLNSAVRLERRLPGYEAVLSCRGNRGWWTTPDTFAEARILREGSGGRQEVVFDYGANPYPDGMIVEGLAVLLRAPWKALERRDLWLQVPDDSGKALVQAVVIARDAREWFVVANVHAGHKLRHFEQALAAREAIAAYLGELIGTARLPGRFGGVLIGGDFNATYGELSTVPWSVVAPGSFDYLDARAKQLHLESALLAWNANTKHKPWANITDPSEARRRVLQAADRFVRVSEQWDAPRLGGHSWRLTEALTDAVAHKRCNPVPQLDGACAGKDRIDLVFLDSGLRTEEASIVYSRNDWSRLDSVSDHPGLWLRVSQEQGSSAAGR